jgi:chitodextrinase
MTESRWTRRALVRALAVFSFLACLPARGLGAGLSVQCHVNTVAPGDNQISPWINVVNGGTAAVALSTVTIRYWYTADGTQSQTYTCDYTARGCANLTSRILAVSPATSTADTALEIGFTAAAGTLAAGQSTGDIQGRINKSDWSNFNEANDYSYAGQTSPASCSKIGLYQSGVLVWGTPPTSGSDTTAPSAPTNLTAPSRTSTSITLSWTASTDNVAVTGYDVYSGATLAQTVAATQATVTGLTPNTTYSFTVRARDASGNVSAPTAALNVTTSLPDTTPPSAPAGLTVTSVTSSSASLSWTASTDNVGVTGYDVYNGTLLTTSVTVTSATITGLAPSTSYSLTVRARDAAGNVSSPSQPVGVQTSAGAVRHEGAYPPVAASSCGSWALVDNVCVPQYCSTDTTSEDCSSCGGNTSASCVKVNSKGGVSGEWPEVHAVGTSEPWHFSRSTHFGLTSGGACGFGLYGLCSSKMAFTDPTLAAQCDAFCKAYPALCADPAGITLRGNFAAPQGNYYSQFWASLPGDRDNYLSCGECYEVVRTKKDGTDYAPGEVGYTPSVVLQLVDSCPCSANSKWCCGSGRDHCGEVSDFKYGCQLPPAPPSPPPGHDPLPNESIHLDLSDIAMARLQTGSPSGSMVDGVIPTRYRRVPCPVVGNAYVWLRSGAGPYWFSLTVVNVGGLGSVVNVEAQLASGAWVSLQRDQNYTSSRPQERYGAWVVPQGAGPFALPVSLRITDASGRAQVASGVIKSWAPADPSQAQTYYIDTGLQF